MNKLHPTGPETSPMARWSTAICMALIVLAGVLVYLNSFDGVFLLDDNAQILENTKIRQLTPVADWLRTRRPVVSLSLAVNYHFGQLRVWGYHLFNLAVHLLAGLTLFGLVRRTLRLSGLRGPWGSTEGFALAVALIWVIHPLQTQSVTYIIQRGESLMGLFYLLALYCTIRGAAEPAAMGAGHLPSTAKNPSRSRSRLPSRQHARRWGWYGLAVMACGLGMAGKAVMITAPLTILLYDRTFLGGSITSAFKRRWGLYAGLASTWLILWAEGVFRLFQTSGPALSTVGFSTQAVSPLYYTLTQPEVILHYLRLCFWPAGQCLDYAWPAVAHARDAAANGSILLAFLLASIWAYFRRPALGFVCVSFFIVLAPTSSVIPIKDLAFEHRMYLPLAAVVLVALWLGRSAAQVLFRKWAVPPVVARWIPRVATVCVVLALGYGTIRRNRVYHSRESMWRNVLRQVPDNPRAHLGLGHVLDQQGRIEQALAQYEKAVQLSPGYAEARTNLGRLLDKMGRSDEAIQQLHRAIALSPHLMKAYRILADLYVRRHQLERGDTLYRKALKANPRWATGHTRLGIILALRGQKEAAIKQFREAIQVDPQLSEPHMYLGFAMQEAGRVEEANREYQIVLRLDPGNTQAKGQLAALKNAHPSGK